jgi:hypothetical protein
MTRIEAPQWIKRLTTVVVILLLCAEAALVLATIHLIHQIRFLEALPPDIRSKYLLIIWGSIVPIPAIVTIIVGYLYYVSAYCVMEFDQTDLRLRRPFREWSGPWSSVRKGYIHGKSLNIQPTDSFWKTWSIRLGSQTLPLVETIKTQLRPGVWLNERQARWYFFRHTAPVIILVGVLMMLGAAYMNHRVFPELNKQTTEFFKNHPKEPERQ